MSMVIEIDTLVLEGMSEEEGRRAAAAFERQLQSLLDMHGLPEGRRLNDLNLIDLGHLPVTMTGPEARGAELARALFSELQS
ncbi:hypothetical protein ROA7450_03103 [Roseovarius albus]|uniref:Uncharacterized protein n=1 Tax=Roseovarius albus TaxID=1247867 RepID=A0A1X6ZS44_9RHOB|nr:hypothetical protein [Roseovarius albus]SLN59817.1 hypothetical protein ROA7450_03103 [Roseovarius albus]